MLRRRPWAKIAYAFGVAVFFSAIGLGGLGSMIVLLTLDDIRA